MSDNSHIEEIWVWGRINAHHPLHHQPILTIFSSPSSLQIAVVSLTLSSTRQTLLLGWRCAVQGMLLLGFTSMCHMDSAVKTCWGLRSSQVLRDWFILPTPEEEIAFSCTQELLGNDLEQPLIGKEREEPLTVFASKITGCRWQKSLVSVWYLFSFFRSAVR